jgi:peroxin-6
MDRIVSQLMAELDGVHSRDSVYVLAATNRPDLLDPALLRPGRFDQLVFIGPPEGAEQEENVLRALTRKFELCADVDLADVARRCPRGLSGADYYGLCAEALIRSIRESAEARGGLKTPSKRYSSNVSCNDSSKDSSNDLSNDSCSNSSAHVEVEVLPPPRSIAVAAHHFDAALRGLMPSLSLQDAARYRELHVQIEGRAAALPAAGVAATTARLAGLTAGEPATPARARSGGGFVLDMAQAALGNGGGVESSPVALQR